jgi:hypothetical protein
MIVEEETRKPVHELKTPLHSLTSNARLRSFQRGRESAEAGYLHRLGPANQRFEPPLRILDAGIISRTQKMQWGSPLNHSLSYINKWKMLLKNKSQLFSPWNEPGKCMPPSTFLLWNWGWDFRFRNWELNNVHSSHLKNNWIKDLEVSGSCGKCGRIEKCISPYWSDPSTGLNRSKDRGLWSASNIFGTRGTF